MWEEIFSAGSQLLGGYLASKRADETQARSEQISATAEERLNRAEQRVVGALTNLETLTPPNLQQYIQPYQQAVAVGQLTPEEAVAQMQQSSSMQGITIPPELLEAQRSALTRLRQIGDEGGLTAIDRARLYDIKEQMATASRGAQEAILQEAQRRGVGGSGIEMANRMLAQQAAATRGARAGVDVAAEAQRRALEAIQQSGTLAGQMRGQEFSEQARQAEAQDAINRFNTEMANRARFTNVEARNRAQAANLAEAQRLQEFNIGQREREAAARLGAAQSGWQNIYNLGVARGNLAAGQATGALTANTAAQQQAANLASQASGQRAGAYEKYIEGVGTFFKD